MKRSKLIIAISVLAVFSFILCGCSYLDTDPASIGGTKADTQVQKAVADTLASHQSTPTDIDYSLERYNLIRRAYWVNGQREKANTLICEVEKPFGYIILFTGTTIVGRFVVDGKVSSLNSYLTPSNVDSVKNYGTNVGCTTITTEMADVDGSYGENDSGIFFFTPDGRYIEWTGTYLYSDIPFEVSNPIVYYEVDK